MRSYNQERINDLLREAIGQIVDRDVKDPRIHFVTITRVETSVDRRYATIFFSILGGEDERDNTLTGLKNATPYIRTRLANMVSLRRIPELRFKYDRNIEYSAHISQLLNQIKSERVSDEERDG
ncbi:MAG: 30S ribosome-binding factor RbfA [Gemmatimonadetes bacterium]|nr:MAG: 30S ribosome-binding factor RbfA [Gemmatimonadota bacterium]